MDNRPYPFPEPAPAERFFAGRRELIFTAVVFLCSIFMWNSILQGGFHLGFSIGAIALISCSAGYLAASGCRFDRYSGCLLVFSLLIAGSFAVASAYLKLPMLLMLLFSSNLSLCLAAGQNRRNPGTAATVLDAPRALFSMGFGGMAGAVRGWNDARKAAGTTGKKTSAVAMGLLLAIPAVAVTAILLKRADAAFESLMNLLPESDWSEPVSSAAFGGFWGWVMYARSVGLKQRAKAEAPAAAVRGIHPITINIPLLAVAMLYLVYLLSQLAYMGGGFLGILPEGYTLAQYARRGFF